MRDFVEIFVFVALIVAVCGNAPEIFFPKCEPIRIDMCRGIGYNETSMPNLVGHEMQTEVEFTLQTFAPLIEYVCSTQLKLFLCAAYVPMCTSKVPVPIGPCRSLCESVRSRCHPVLQGFGFPWPPALNCSRFPKENNHETMCMEGPGEAHSPMHENEMYGISKLPTKLTEAPLKCPGISKSDLYVKLLRSGRCAPLCDADILFGQHEKHLAEIWVATWTYAALGLAIIATICLFMGNDSKASSKWSVILTPLLWCHNMTVIGWTVRFVAGRTASSCGFDPQLPNVSLLLVDGLSNVYCAATFLLRYYFGMAACAWWAILCLGWHREIRRNSPEAAGGHITVDVLHKAQTTHGVANRVPRIDAKRGYDVTQSNLACFAAWGLPAFQTAAVIVSQLVDADELLGACLVGNQSDKGLQVLVATPLFCYWIFGSMNLISGYLVYRRNKEIMQSTNSAAVQYQLQMKCANSGIGTFLFIYCAPCALMLLAVIYEFANIDLWLNVPPYLRATEQITTPMWPFLTRVFMELMLGIICSAWVLGPKISMIYKRQLAPRNQKPAPTAVLPHASVGVRHPNTAYSTISYHTVRHPSGTHSQPHSLGTVSLNQMSNYSLGARSKSKSAGVAPSHMYINYKKAQQLQRYGNETIL